MITMNHAGMRLDRLLGILSLVLQSLRIILFDPGETDTHRLVHQIDQVRLPSSLA
jgi:hypothetical protein